VEFSQDIFKRRIASLLPAKAAGKRVNGSGQPGPSASKQDPTDLSGLWSVIDDEQFVQEAYRRILGRECDVSGFVNYLELLRRHVPRRVVVLQLVDSDEAKRRGIRFVGIPGSVSAAGRQAALTPLRRFAGRALSQVRDLLRRPLSARFDSIDHKLNFILHDVTAKADNLSAKTDQALWTISKKLDTYVADLQEYQFQIRQVLSQESAASTEALARVAGAAEQKLAAISQNLDTHVAALREQQNMQAAGLREQQDQLHQDAAANTEAIGHLRARSSELLDQQAATRSLIEDDRSRIAGIESRQREVLDQLAGLRETAAATRSRLFPPAIAAGDNVVATEVDGFILGMPGEEWRMAAYHAFRGVMEPGLTTRFRGLVKPGMVVVDVGANIGIYTLYAARMLQGKGKIHSFEPTPRTYRILRDNVQVNGFLELGLIELHQVAVSDRAGQAGLVVFPDDSGHNTLFEEGVVGPSGTGIPACVRPVGERIEVSTVSLDEVLKDEPRVDVVKIDAEGAEPLILSGMRKIVERSPGIRILMEFAPVHLRRAGVDPGGFLDEIASWGFDIRRIHDETGQPLEASRDQLTAVFSANLELARPGGHD